MSEKEKLIHKENLKRLDIKRLEKIDKLLGKAGIVVGSLLLILSLIISFIRG